MSESYSYTDGTNAVTVEFGDMYKSGAGFVSGANIQVSPGGMAMRITMPQFELLADSLRTAFETWAQDIPEGTFKEVNDE